MSQDNNSNAKSKDAEAKAAEKAKIAAEAEAAEKAKAEALAKAAAESESKTNAQASPAPKPSAEVKANQADEKDPGAKTPLEKPAASLKSVADWAIEKNLAGWQTAALLRANGWTDDKQVSEEELKSALARAMNKPQGGGRR